jgi:hypothetical protein
LIHVEFFRVLLTTQNKNPSELTARVYLYKKKVYFEGKHKMKALETKWPGYGDMKKIGLL